jgi:hypothetical protein
MAEGGQMKAGVRNALIVLLFVVILVPALKVGVEKVPSIPEGIKNWIRAI